jgi:hypothetical protein
MEFWFWNLAFMILSGIILFGRKRIDVPNPLKAYLIPLAGFVFVSTALSTFLQIVWSLPD